MSLEKLRSVLVGKGKTNSGVPAVCWDAIAECVPDQCYLGETCKYKKAGAAFFKCFIQMNYVRAVYDTIFLPEVVNDTLTPEKSLRLGLSVLPLYIHLVKLKIVEYGLKNPLTFSERGTISVHPIYKEIRETIKTIHGVMRDIPLGMKSKLKEFEAPNIGDYVDTKSNLYGNPDYYEQMYEHGTEEITEGTIGESLANPTRHLSR